MNQKRNQTKVVNVFTVFMVMLILYFILKKAFYRALVKFHDTHGFVSPYVEAEEPYEPTPEEAVSEQLPGQAQ